MGSHAGKRSRLFPRPRADRRRTGGLAAAALLLTLGLTLAGTQPVATAPRAPAPESLPAEGAPDIVLILTDDQRVGTLKRMPNLQAKLRKKGVQYVEAGAPTSLCCPARASILTGLFAHTTRVYTNGDKSGSESGGWPLFRKQGLESRTLATALQGVGYRTALVGKYLNGGFVDAAAEGYRPPGWDELVTYMTPLKDEDLYFNYTLTDGKWYGERPEDYSTDVFARHAVDFIGSTPAEQPLFLYFNPAAPHRPYSVPPQDEGFWEGRIPSYRPPSLRGDLSGKPPWLRSLEPVSQAAVDDTIAKAQNTLNGVDRAVGDIVDAMDAAGRSGNTLFVFMSDNGTMFGEHRVFQRKNQPYRWSTMIPLLMRWDGHIEPRSTDDRLAVNIDVTTTISEAAGLEMRTEGLNLLGPDRRTGYPLEAAKWHPTSGLPRKPAYCGYRTRRWMFVQYTNGFREVYDYRRDPHELVNLAGKKRYAEKERALRAAARASCRPVPDSFHW